MGVNILNLSANSVAQLLCGIVMVQLITVSLVIRIMRLKEQKRRKIYRNAQDHINVL